MATTTRLPRIRDIGSGASGAAFFLCSHKEVRTTRRGVAFLLATLQDATGEISGKVFEDFERYRDEFDAGEFVRVEGTAEIHAGRVELVLSRIRRVNPEQDRADGFREADCIPSSPRDAGEMWQELEAGVSGVRDSGIRALLMRVLQDHGPQLRIWPAALVVHHAYRGGLLEHILQVARVCGALAKIYGADEDLLFAGAVLHDIGKLRELDYDLTTAYTREGHLVGHIPLGLLLVREAAAGLASLTADRRGEIEHLIASHHGLRELGSPVEPMTPEAFLLAAADNLDARMHQVHRHLLEDDAAGEFTSYHQRLKRVLLRPAAPRAGEPGSLAR
jgi:3'-5' exoribonuclease